MIEKNIKNCPCCGGHAELGELDGTHYYRCFVFCMQCGLSTAYEHIPSIAIATWNERPNCFGCKYIDQYENEAEYSYSSPCTSCARRARDNYENSMNHDKR